MEQGETEGDVKREMKEEANLDVKVNRLLFNEPALDGDTFSQRLRTYLCEPLSSVAKPGYNPEYDPPIEAAGLHGILEVMV